MVVKDNWETLTINDLTKVFTKQTGFDYSAYIKPALIQEYRIGYIPFIQNKDFKGKFINYKTDYYVPESIAKNFPQILLNENCLLISISGSIGNVAIFNNLQVGFIGGAIAVAKFKNKELLEWCMYYLLSNEGQNKLLGNVKAGSHQNLILDDLRKIKIPIPPKKEQKAIVKVLSDTDELINSLEKLISKKEAIKQGTMQQLLTGKKRLNGFNEKWEVKTLGDVGIFLKGKELPKSCLSTDAQHECIHYGELFTQYNEIVKKIKHFTNTYDNPILSLDNDILMPTSDVTPNGLATASCIKKDGVILGGDILIIRTNKKEFDGSFIAYYISLDKNQVLRLVSGITVFHLYGSDMANFLFKSPPKKEQKAISKILSDMDNEIETLKSQLTKLKAIKNGVMSELLTGKTRLLGKKEKVEKHNKHFEDAVIIGVLSDMFSSEKYPLGRKKYTKLSYLLHRKHTQNTEQYLKKAAGPYNPTTRYGGAEKIAINKKYVKNFKNGNYSGFVISENINEAKEYFSKWFGDDTVKWLEQFRYHKNDYLELLATIDMAVQDLINAKQLVNLQSVKGVICSHKEWKPKLKREIFSDKNIKKAIDSIDNLFGR